MNLSQQLAHQFREAHLDGKWLANTNLKEELENINWQQANAKVGDHNSIALLAFHLNYYVDGICRVFEGGPLDISDKYAFDTSPVESEQQWETLKEKLWSDAERFARLVEQIPEAELDKPFANLNYGSNYLNISTMIQHIYYHLGQIVLIRKLLAGKDSSEYHHTL